LPPTISATPKKVPYSKGFLKWGETDLAILTGSTFSSKEKDQSEGRLDRSSRTRLSLKRQ
jgi:hypothetical protein